MKTLYVLDASGYVYRNYYAIRNMTNPKGESTNALFGFIPLTFKTDQRLPPRSPSRSLRRAAQRQKETGYLS